MGRNGSFERPAREEVERIKAEEAEAWPSMWDAEATHHRRR
jgi:hypothetical protein